MQEMKNVRLLLPRILDKNDNKKTIERYRNANFKPYMTLSTTRFAFKIVVVKIVKKLLIITYNWLTINCSKRQELHKSNYRLISMVLKLTCHQLGATVLN